MSEIIVTVEFEGQLAATNRPVSSALEATRLIQNECAFGNTIQAYAWTAHARQILFCQHGPAADSDLNIDTLVEDYRI